LLFAIIHDITERRQMEIALKESEALYKAVVNNSLNIILISVNKIIEFTNDAASDFTGMPQEEIIGRSIDEVYKSVNYGVERNSLAEIIMQSIDNNQAVEVQIQEKNSDNTNYFLVRSNTIQYKGKEAIMSIFIDITENKNIEKYVLKRVIETEENDRKKFAADLHDDLGPILSTIKLRLDLMENLNPTAKELKENISISNELIGLVVEKIRTISHNITPHLIDSFGLDTGVRDLCKRIKELNKIDFEYESNIENRRFPQSLELHYYRIISELINNTLKHSQGKLIKLILFGTEDKLELTYSDNGIGYNYSESLQKPGGIGLRNILNRVTLINGIIKFQVVEGKTVVKISKKLEPALLNIT
ncbi:MAG: PAS domain S-box protein, partial [Clostridiales bacterium]